MPSLRSATISWSQLRLQIFLLRQSARLTRIGLRHPDLLPSAAPSSSSVNGHLGPRP